MLKDISLINELTRQKSKLRKHEDVILDEVNRLLNANLLSEKNILNNLKFYNKTFELLDEEVLDKDRIFKLNEIKVTCTKFRLRFIDSQFYRGEIPYEAILKIKELNETGHKDLKGFKILGSRKTFLLKEKNPSLALFAPTVNGNYYHIHSWGAPIKWYKKWLAWPFQSFENLFITVALFTLIITLLLPVRLITLDREAPYWCGYRIATFFHLLIFNSGVTVYFTFAFNKNFSKSIWNSTLL